MAPRGTIIRPAIRRLATISVHTSPLDPPGTGDAGGMNVYIVEVSRRLAELGVEVDIFTRATSSDLPPVVELAPGVQVRHVTAGPFEGLAKADLPAQLCAFAAGVLRTEAVHEPGHYDLVHSHYWLSGQVGWVAKERWGVPLVHSMHTMAKVKNAFLADGDVPEPPAREIGEAQVVTAADRLVANADDEAASLVDLYGAHPGRVFTVAPGVDLSAFRPGPTRRARRALGLPDDAVVLLFVGRVQPLKAPDVLVRAAGRMIAEEPGLRERLVVAIVGGPSGSGGPGNGAGSTAVDAGSELDHLRRLVVAEGLDDVVRFEPPASRELLADWYRAATVTVVPSYSESFGLVAVESQACGTPVVASAVGGLRTAVADGTSGTLVDGHDPAAYAAALRAIVDHPRRRRALSEGAVRHARRFGWSATLSGLLRVYTGAMAGHASSGAALRPEHAHRLALAVNE